MSFGHNLRVKVRFLAAYPASPAILVLCKVAERDECLWDQSNHALFERVSNPSSEKGSHHERRLLPSLGTGSISHPSSPSLPLCLSLPLPLSLSLFLFPSLCLSLSLTLTLTLYPNCPDFSSRKRFLADLQSGSCQGLTIVLVGLGRAASVHCQDAHHSDPAK